MPTHRNRRAAGLIALLVVLLSVSIGLAGVAHADIYLPLVAKGGPTSRARDASRHCHSSSVSHPDTYRDKHAPADTDAIPFVHTVSFVHTLSDTHPCIHKHADAHPHFAACDVYEHSNCNANAQSHADGYGHSESDADAHANPNSYSYCYADTYANDYRVQHLGAGDWEPRL